jgi:arsenical pump membrane protein
VALACALVTYLLLGRCFRRVLDDEAPALGEFPGARPLGPSGRAVVLVLGLGLTAYPIVSLLDAPVWPIALGAASLTSLARLAAGHRPLDLVRGVPWAIFPFLTGVFVLALALERIGVVDHLEALYASSPARPVIVGFASAGGSALLNNHPMSVLNALALERLPADDALAFAALIGGDLGPRLLPLGSLAALLWFDVLRRHGVAVGLGQFFRLGVVLTLPTMVVCLALLLVLVS